MEDRGGLETERTGGLKEGMEEGGGKGANERLSSKASGEEEVRRKRGAW